MGQRFVIDLDDTVMEYPPPDDTMTDHRPTSIVALPQRSLAGSQQHDA